MKTEAARSLLVPAAATIIDDTPSAVNDGPVTVTEDGAGAANTATTSTVSGDVLANDSAGADAPRAFDVWAAGNAANVAALNAYGTLTLNGDGTYSFVLDNTRAATQALTAGSTLSYNLNYTMKDADGDTSPATLTIVIKGANDGSSVVTAQATGPDGQVLEHGLVVAADSETTTGSFTVSTTDGIQNVVIGGTTFTYAQLTNAAYLASHPVNTGEGVLTLTGFTGTAFGGTVNYSYTLSATIDNDSKAGATPTGFDDSVVLTVNGIGGTTASDDLVIRIVDDTPSAVNDGPVTVTEDGAGAANTATTSTVSGDVLANDSAGADAPMAFDVWAAGNAANVAALNAYGTLTLNGDGTYSFVLDNTRAATQALTAGSTLSYNLNYTMKDADGDTSPATLTIVIKGANDGSSVVTAQATGPDGQVLEHGLVVAADSETTTGSFTVSTTDGIQNVVIGGTTFTYAQLTNAAYLASHPVNTGEGVLTLTGFTGTAFGGTVNYSYTLSATIDNDSKAGATPTGFDDSVVLTVNGIGGTTASDDLVIRIVDDTPSAVNDGPVTVTEDGAGAANTATTSTVSGDVLANDSAGADAPMAFDVWAAGNAANVAALNAYGTLTLNGDGTYSFVLDNTRAATQALTAGSTLSYNLNYTMKDADGDTSPATLTIVIKGANDGSSVVTAQATGPDGQVLEHGLVVAADSETTTGSFTVSTTDGIQNVVIGGTTFTYAQLTNAAYLASHPVNTGEGVLTLTGFTGTAFGGTVNYSYTLSATIDNDSKAGATPTGFDDSVVLTVNGIGGTTASDDLVIRIVDDTPSAVNDGPVTVTEDGAGAANTATTSTVSGDVLANDSAGADAPRAFDVWAAGNAANVAALNAYGTLTLNGDGTYSFVLDNTRAATQALTAGSTLSYNLNYTMKDADGDTSPATLTIVIKGANDGSSVVTAQATGPDGQVLEHGLVVAADSETTTGSFTVSTTDGIQNVVIGGTTFTYAQLTNAAYLASHPVNTGEGVLTLTGFTGTAFGGTVNYSYTLSATIDNDSKAGATPTGFDDSVVLTVNGIGGTTASDDLVIRIVDDTPSAVNDGPVTVTEDGAGAANTATTSTVSGDVLANDSAGADAPRAFDVWAAGNAANVAALNAYGTLTLNGDGTYSFVLDNTRAATQALTAGSTLSYNLNYTMKDADGDTSPATLTIVIKGANDGSSVVTAQATGPDGQVLEHGLVVAADSETTTGSFTVSTTDGIQNVVIGGTTFTYAQLTNAAYLASHPVNTGEGVLTLTGFTGTAFGGTVNYSYTLSATIDNDSKAGATPTGFDDSVVLTVNGIGGTTASDDLVIRIVDDTPSAVNDGPVTVTEDGAGAANTATTSTVSGDVLANDSAGADAPMAFDVWAAGNAANVAALNAYGTLTLNGDGTYSFVLDNTRAATQALTAGSTLSYNLNYTMKDADGDTSPATLTIVIKGANDGSSVVTAQATGPDGQVLEHGLVVAADSETTTGSFTVSTTDGIQNVVIGGTTFTYAQLTNAAYLASHPVNTGEGVLTLTGFTGTAFGGTVNYSYTLSATIDNDSKAGATPTGFDDSVVLTVNGIGGTTASDDLVIRIVDDTPSAVNDGPVTVTEDGAGAANTATTSTVSGDVLANDSAGADAPSGV